MRERDIYLEPDIYQYPEHLLEHLETLPKESGVYVFHGLSDTMPLYIGKSINIRSRVMSHFRAKDEAKLLRQTTRISCIETAGELGALLLEAQMIKKLQPLFNKRLRRSKQLCSLRFINGNVEVVYAKDINFSLTPNLYGLFSNKKTALERLRSIADEHQLCYGLTGIEKLQKNRACFRFSLRKCAGACCGRETTEEHNQRLFEALSLLQLCCWQYPGRIAIKEASPQLTQYHVIHNWFYLGTVESLNDIDSLSQVADHFDSDGYKILCKPLISGKLDFIIVDEY